MKPISYKFEEANKNLADSCMACASSCCKKGLLLLLPEEKDQIESWIKDKNPDLLQRFTTNLKDEQEFYLFDQEDRCMFLEGNNLCVLHSDGVKPQECFVWPLHVYLGNLGNPEIRVSTSCCEGFKFISKDSPSVDACQNYAEKIGHERLSRFRELYGGSYGNILVKEINLPLKVRALTSNELGLYRTAGEASFANEDWDKGMIRVSRMHAKHSDGILAYVENGKIYGYTTLWPLSDSAITQLKTGELIDSDIDETSMPDLLSKSITNWIITAIAVNESGRLRRRQIVSGLLFAVYTRLAQHTTSQVFAHAASDRGRSFLSRKGFQFEFPNAESLCVLKVTK